MRRPSPLQWFAIATIALATGGVYSTCARERSLPVFMEYAPRESRAIVATDQIDALWDAVARNFFSRRTGTRDSAPLEEWVAHLRAELEGRGIVIGGSDDLAAYGIDVRRGMLVALHAAQTLGRLDVEAREAVHGVAVVPVTDFAAFVAALARAMDAETQSDTTVQVDGVPVPVTSIGQRVHAIEPQDGVAVVGSSVAILARSAADRRANLVFHRGDDVLHAGIRRLRRQRRVDGPTVLLHGRPPSIQGLGTVTGALSVGVAGAELVVDVEVASGFLHVLDDLMTPVAAERARIPAVPQTVGGVVVATDDAVYHSSVLDRWLRDVLPAWPGPLADLIDELRRTAGVDQMALTLAGSDNGVPETVLLARGAPDTLTDLVSRLRARLVSGRDRAILAEARNRYRGGDLTVRSLLDEGLLSGGDDQRWTYYRFAGDAIVFDTTVTLPGLLRPSEYERRSREFRVQLLSPPVTADDLRYNDALADADSAWLASDRYRVAAVQLDSALWLAPDPDVLVAFLRRAPPAEPPLADRPIYRAARRNGPTAPKVELFLDVDRVIALGLLDTDADVQETSRRVLAQLQGHQAVTATLARSDANHARLTVRLLRSGGEPPP